MMIWKTSTDFDLNIKHASPFFRIYYEFEFTNCMNVCQAGRSLLRQIKILDLAEMFKAKSFVNIEAHL